MNKRFIEEDIRLLVSKNLKRLREMQNISQFSLALKAELTHNFINDVENGKKGISCKSLAKLSSALMVEPFQFFLPESVPDDFIVYSIDLNDSIQKVVGQVIGRYLPEKKEEETQE